MLKEQLLKEAQDIEASVELDGVFESVELSDEVKENFSVVFEAAVKKNAVKLAESHINVIAESADKKVEELVAEKTTAIETSLKEEAQKYLEHIGSEWLVENKLQVRNDIKASLFEGMLTGMKTLFIENNVVVPEESVDIVAEMEMEANENKLQANKLFEENVSLKASILDMQRVSAIKEATEGLTESQAEKVTSLTEGMKFNTGFESKLSAIVEMVKGSEKTKPITEATIPVEENPNFEPSQEPAVVTEAQDDPFMRAYANV